MGTCIWQREKGTPFRYLVGERGTEAMGLGGKEKTSATPFLQNGQREPWVVAVRPFRRQEERGRRAMGDERKPVHLPSHGPRKKKRNMRQSRASRLSCT